jgi:hypothetical protein
VVNLNLHKELADELEGFGGVLRCTVCGHEKSLNDIAGWLKGGWPRHCNYTMRWYTQRELDKKTGVPVHGA